MRLALIGMAGALALAVGVAAPAYAGVNCPAARGDAYSSAVLADAPVAYYRLDEPAGPDMCDASASANDGTYAASGVSYAATGALLGDSDAALSGDGSSSALIGTSNANSAITGDVSFSLEAWFKSTGGAQNQSLVAIGASGNGHIAGMTTWSSVCTSSTSVLGLDEFAGSDCWDTTSVATLFDGRFHHLVVTYDAATHVVTGYVDAHNLGSHAVSTIGGTFSLSASPVRVGTWIDTVVNKPFRGVLDEVAVYPAALPAARVAAHYAAASPASKRRSATQVICNRGADPMSDATCTATVGDASSDTPKVTPTGTVTFTAGEGGFPQGATCSLSQTPNATGVASCDVTYANSAGIAAGTVLPITAAYSGDANFEASSGTPQLGGGPVAPPTTPATGTTGCAGASQRATVPTVPAPEYCDYRAKYTAKEKADAKEWKRSYTDRAMSYNQLAWTHGTMAIAATGEPPAATALAAWAAMDSFISNSYSTRAETMSRINEDPPDPDWRTLAAPPRTSTARLKLPRALRNYAAATLRATALDICVSQSIDRSASAFGNHEPLVAARQYAAGAACGAEAATLARGMPKLAAKAAPALAELARTLRHVRVPRHLNARRRARVAATLFRSVTGAIALSAAGKSAIRKQLTALSRTTPRRPKPNLAKALEGAAAEQVRWATLSEQSAHTLAAAAATQLGH